MVVVVTGTDVVVVVAGAGAAVGAEVGLAAGTVRSLREQAAATTAPATRASTVRWTRVTPGTVPAAR
jgi:hypothetical protein